MRRKWGFTIVELVVVVILFGMLAATALPRFFKQEPVASEADLQAAHDRLQAGIAAFHARYLAHQPMPPDTALAELGGLRANAYGYPYGTADRRDSGSNVASPDDCAAVLVHVARGSAPSVAGVADAAAVVGVTAEYAAVLSPGPSCTYYYTGHGSRAGLMVPTLIYDPGSGVVEDGAAVL